MNHSQIPELEEYHGRACAIDLNADNLHLPFYSSFLIEMQVCGWWPFHTDRPILLPVEWQRWISAAAPANEDTDADADEDADDAAT